MKEKERFTITEAYIISRKAHQYKLTPNECILLSEIVDTGRVSGRCFATNNELSRKSGLCTRLIRRAYTGLIDKGWLKEEKKDGYGTRTVTFLFDVKFDPNVKNSEEIVGQFVRKEKDDKRTICDTITRSTISNNNIDILNNIPKKKIENADAFDDYLKDKKREIPETLKATSIALQTFIQIADIAYVTRENFEKFKKHINKFEGYESRVAAILYRQYKAQKQEHRKLFASIAWTLLYNNSLNRPLIKFLKLQHNFDPTTIEVAAKRISTTILANDFCKEVGTIERGMRDYSFASCSDFIEVIDKYRENGKIIERKKYKTN